MNNHQCDVAMRFDNNGGGSPNDHAQINNAWIATSFFSQYC
jgi:hypothetical protein